MPQFLPGSCQKLVDSHRLLIWALHSSFFLAAGRYQQGRKAGGTLPASEFYFGLPEFKKF